MAVVGVTETKQPRNVPAKGRLAAVRIWNANPVGMEGLNTVLQFSLRALFFDTKINLLKCGSHSFGRLMASLTDSSMPMHLRPPNLETSSAARSCMSANVTCLSSFA
jgi:hypothetical protein